MEWSGVSSFNRLFVTHDFIVPSGCYSGSLKGAIVELK